MREKDAVELAWLELLDADNYLNYSRHPETGDFVGLIELDETVRVVTYVDGTLTIRRADRENVVRDWARTCVGIVVDDSAGWSDRWVLSHAQ